MARKKSNPNGANQYLVDPRQALFLSCYLDPKSETFSNGLQSALKAGYTQEYAESLLDKMPKWLAEKVGELSMLYKAERNLDKMLDLEEESEGKLRVKADITKFVAERLGRKKYGTQEKPQGDTFNTIIFTDEQSAEIARRRLAGNRPSEKESN